MNRGSGWRRWKPIIYAPGTVMNNHEDTGSRGAFDGDSDVAIRIISPA